MGTNIFFSFSFSPLSPTLLLCCLSTYSVPCVVSSFLLHLIFNTASMLFVSPPAPYLSLCISHPFLYSFLFLLSTAFSQCDQDQCIQSTKFVLQAAATPLLQQQSSQPVILTASPENGGSLPGRTSLTLGGPCTSLPLGQPTPPTSTPSLSCHEATDMLPIHGHSHTHNHSHPHQEPVAHHHFLTPEEVPSPPGMLPCGSPLGHSHTMQAGFYNPASQDSLHEDSVRGLVKLSSVWQWDIYPLPPPPLSWKHVTHKTLLCHVWTSSLSPSISFPFSP